MRTTHDDLPHPVPPSAYLRYKENWFFILMDVEREVYGMAHFNYEPGHDRARVSCNLMVRGEVFKYGNQIAFPSDFALSREIGDDKLRVSFIEAHTRIEMRLKSDAADLEVSFVKHAPTFDFEAYQAANPEQTTPGEIINFATNQMYHHQQQAMTIAGRLTMKAGAAQGETLALQGLGYRDHSRGMRADNLLLRHDWSFLYFPKTVVGVMSLAGALRPTLSSRSGYVHDAAGTRSLKDIAITHHGKIDDGMPATVEFKLTDVYGQPLTVVADIAKRMGQVPLVVEAAGPSGHGYRIVENFCPVTLQETGETGYALVEIGHSTTAALG